jgi:division protein CdvB (Snf7/Vps24/ESCRT-III family)
MKQSSIFKEEIFKEKQKADKYLSNFESIRKITDKILDVWFSKEDMRDDLSDCFEHLSKVYP